MKLHKPLFLFLALLALALVVILASCKTQREPSALGPHPAGWMDPTSAAFHGFPAIRDSNNCRSCHGQDLHGGSAGVGCYQCHVSYPHPAAWLDTTSSNFHGLVAKMDSSKQCAGCHGADFNGGISTKSCRRCHEPYPHVNFANWQQPVTADSSFHGWQTMSDTVGAGVSCQPCHGANFRGTARAQSCYDCHTVLHVGVENENISTHRSLVAARGWHITSNCAVCHGSDFTGGRAATIDDAANCTQCHNPSDDVMRLNGCNVCHTTDPSLRTFWKVPFTMDSLAYGAHPVHVEKQKFACRECHPSLSSAGHPHALPADVSFVRAVLADTFGMSPTATHLGAPTSGDASCSNVYCHSNGLNPNLPHPQNPGPPVTFPAWRDSLHCGACHGIPPLPSVDPNHPQGSEARICVSCHTDIDPNSNFTIPDSIRFTNDSLHVDAKVEGIQG